MAAFPISTVCRSVRLTVCVSVCVILCVMLTRKADEAAIVQKIKGQGKMDRKL